MEQLTLKDIEKLAAASPRFAQMIKCAATGGTYEFNEDVPASAVSGASTPMSSSYAPNNQPAGQVPQYGNEEVPPEDEYAAVPEEEGAAMQEEMPQDSPEAAGARAAQAFMGPIFDAAMAGDPAAMELIAKAAGNVAGSVSKSYNESAQMGGQMMGDGGQMMDDGSQQAPTITSPEEDLANDIVGEVKQPPPESQAPSNEEQQPEQGNSNKPRFPEKK